MKLFITIPILGFLLFSTKGFSQKVSETFFSAGANILKSTDFRNYYDEECTSPTFLNLGVTHSWYRTDRKVTFNKEIGLNFQYSSPDLSSGGLGAHSYSSYKLLNLFGEATIQTQIKIDSTMSIGIGPTVEYMIVGYNRVNTSYYYLADTHYINGECSHAGFNRNYFGNPLWGIKLSVFNFAMREKATFKVNFSYFWMKENKSNFHSSSYIKVGMAIGFRHKKNPGNSKDE